MPSPLSPAFPAPCPAPSRSCDSPEPGRLATSVASSTRTRPSSGRRRSPTGPASSGSRWKRTRRCSICPRCSSICPCAPRSKSGSWPGCGGRCSQWPHRLMRCASRAPSGPRRARLRSPPRRLSPACNSACSWRERARCRPWATTFFCSPRPVRAGSAWRSRGWSDARRSAAFPSTGWRSCSARQANTVRSSKRPSRAPASPPISPRVRSSRIPPGGPSSRCWPAPPTAFPRAGSRNT